MSEMTMATCPSCGHEGKPQTRRVVVCDTCGAQADMVRSPYVGGLVSPEGWTGNFHHVDPEPGSNVISTDFCSWRCARDFERWHERAQVYA